MCDRISRIALNWISLILYVVGCVNCHIPFYVTTPSNKIEQFCALADTCVHDTIPICGKMGDEKRTFLDLCDLLEHACDSNEIYVHVDDMPGCPPKKQKT